MTPEFSRLVRIDTLGERVQEMRVDADAAERAALAKRFGLVALDRLGATAALVRKREEVRATGRLQALATQSCIATGAPMAAEIDEPFDIVFRPQPGTLAPEEEVELGGDELDVAFYEGAAVDLGEAAAETLALALDPYPRAPGAEAALKAAGVKSEEEAGPFGALSGLKDKLGK